MLNRLHQRHYYIVPRDIAIAGAKHFMNSHWIDLDATHVLLSVRHKTDWTRQSP